MGRIELGFMTPAGVCLEQGFHLKREVEGAEPGVGPSRRGRSIPGRRRGPGRKRGWGTAGSGRGPGRGWSISRRRRGRGGVVLDGGGSSAGSGRALWEHRPLACARRSSPPRGVRCLGITRQPAVGRVGEWGVGAALPALSPSEVPGSCGVWVAPAVGRSRGQRCGCRTRDVVRACEGTPGWRAGTWVWLECVGLRITRAGPGAELGRGCGHTWAAPRRSGPAEATRCGRQEPRFSSSPSLQNSSPAVLVRAGFPCVRGQEHRFPRRSLLLSGGARSTLTWAFSSLFHGHSKYFGNKAQLVFSKIKMIAPQSV